MATRPRRWLFKRLLQDRLQDWHLNKLGDILGPIGKGISASNEFIARAERSGSPEYADAVADDEVELVEGLLGAAFVVCQTQIERVAKTVADLHRCANSLATPVQLTTTTTHRTSIIAFGSHHVAGTTVTEIEALNATANYFKHRDSWPVDWHATISTASAKGADHATTQAARTMMVLHAMGLQGGSTGNLRTASEVLGNPSGYEDVRHFVSILRDWQLSVFMAYQNELKAAGEL